MRNSFLILFLAISFVNCAQEPQIIPQPVSLKAGKGQFTINKSTILYVKEEADQKSADFLNDYLQNIYGFKLTVSKATAKNGITIATKKFIKAPEKDGYDLVVSPSSVNISGDTYAGSFYGVQSLIQLLPVVKSPALKVPAVVVRDEPRFAYRGLHLDVGRHFFPLSFIKKYIDYIAYHKMNRFHWHLTDDQGWRIEIKKYPRLTEIGGWRNGTIIGRYPGKGNDGKKYGGFYTQEEAKEIVQYAADRHIEVIAEIELPGHASAAIAAYPELSCFPEEPTYPKYFPKQCTWGGDTTGKQVQQTWGVFEDVFCAGKDHTFTFLQDVLDEVLPIFPSKIIHIGGDECPKENWKRCPQCQQRMKDNNLKDEHELQSYFIQRMEKYLNGKGKTIIGWDEILEGGLAPNAMVMSWRGEEGGITAAKQNHYVVMTPGNPVYFDHTQSQKEDSVTIGGYNPIEKVYAYDPQPAALNAEQAKYIMGGQANLWTEYMKYPSKVEYMLFPRISALSELLWSPKEKKNWNDFQKRLDRQFKRYGLWKVNYSKAYFDISLSVQPVSDNSGVEIKAETKAGGGALKYKWGNDQKLYDYTAPVPVKQSSTFIASYYTGGKNQMTSSQEIILNKATGKKATLVNEPSKGYPGVGAFTLVDGIQNKAGLSRSKEFLGFEGIDCEALIDLGSVQQISTVVLHTLESTGSWIYRPKYFQVQISTDGNLYTQMGITDRYDESAASMNATMTVNQKSVAARYIRIKAGNYGDIPTGQAGAGHKAWLFVGEVTVQ